MLSYNNIKMYIKNLKNLVIILIPILSGIILIQNPIMVTFASPAPVTDSNVSSFAADSNMTGNDGFANRRTRSNCQTFIR